MPIIAKFESSFIPAPSGLHRAVCVDVIDLGIVKRVYNGEMSMPHMIKLVWQIEPTMDDGSHFIITKDYTLALSPRANLYRDLTSWRKKEFTDDELEEIRAKFSAGLSIDDANAIREIVPLVEDIAPQAEKEVTA